MSAMPERVLAYISVFGTYSQTKDEYHDVECILVPESALLAAEARAKAMEDGPLDYMSGKCDRLKEQNAALRADLDALVPLARVGLNAYDYVLAKEQYGKAIVPVLDRVSLDESLTQARAILAREAE